jgi:hypothetical protein
MAEIAPEQPHEDGGLAEEVREVEAATDLDEERLASEGEGVLGEEAQD